jgi:polyhydroxybutyrate depolymerase
MRNQSRFVSSVVFVFILLCGLAVGACGHARERGNRAQGQKQAAAVSGVDTHRLSVAGTERAYLLFVPARRNPEQAMPLVIVLHGGGANAERMLAIGMNDIAEANGFMVAYPDGIGRGKKHSWNAGSPIPQGYAEEVRVDDVGFVSRMIDDIASKQRLDADRVYVTGASKGGMLAYRLACELSERIAAIAPVAATMVVPECRPSRPVAVFHVHGGADENVPLHGGRGDYTGAAANYPAVPEVIEKWRQIDQCQAQPKQEKISSASCSRYEGCRAGVVLCVIEGSGHGWPGVQTERQKRRGGINMDFHTSAEVWRFFSSQSLRP